MVPRFPAARKTMNHWLIKSEPKEYSIDDLKRDKKIGWTGVRNYQARNFIKDKMKIGDLALFYHSSIKEPAIVGLVKICSRSYPEKDRSWAAIDVCFIKKFKKTLTIKQLKSNKSFKNMLAVKKGCRLSVQPVLRKDFQVILKLTK